MEYDEPYLLGFKYSRPDDVKDIRHLRSMSPRPLGSLRAEPSPRPPHAAVWPAQGNSTDQQQQGPSSDDSSTASGSRNTLTTPVPASPAPPPYTRTEIVPNPITNRVKLDIRHHPYRRKYPNRRYRHGFDLYSLGIVLVEIGMGQVLESMFPGVDEPDPYEARRMLLSWVQQEMPPVCGKIYTEATLAFLAIDPEESEAELATQRQLCARVTIQLAQCRA